MQKGLQFILTKTSKKENRHFEIEAEALDNRAAWYFHIQDAFSAAYKNFAKL